MAFRLPKAIGFRDCALPDLAQAISKVIGLPAERRDNSYWGNYYRFRTEGHRDFILVRNEEPKPDDPLGEVAEPEFLAWDCIFWINPKHDSEELTRALLSIDGATLLRAGPQEGAETASSPASSELSGPA